MEASKSKADEYYDKAVIILCAMSRDASEDGTAEDFFSFMDRLVEVSPHIALGLGRVALDLLTGSSSKKKKRIEATELAMALLSAMRMVPAIDAIVRERLMATDPSAAALSLWDDLAN